MRRISSTPPPTWPRCSRKRRKRAQILAAGHQKWCPAVFIWTAIKLPSGGACRYDPKSNKRLDLVLVDTIEATECFNSSAPREGMHDQDSDCDDRHCLLYFVDVCSHWRAVRAGAGHPDRHHENGIAHF